MTADLARDVPLFSVLVIDDDAGDRRLVARMLSGTGHTVTACAGSAAGLAAMLDGDHDAWVIDYRLDGEDGLALLARAREAGRRSAAILLTGSNDPGLDPRAIELGAAARLDKGGLTAERLDRAIRYAVHQSRDRAALELREARQRALLGARGDGLWDWDARRDVVYLSRRWWWLVGQDRPGGEFPRDALLAPLRGEDRRRAEARLAQVVAEGGAPPLSVHMHGADGHAVTVIVRWVAVRDAQGAVVRVVGACRPVDRPDDPLRPLLDELREDRAVEQLDHIARAGRDAQAALVHDVADLDPSSFFGRLLDAGLRVAECRAGVLAVLDDDGGLRVEALAGLPAQAHRERAVPPGLADRGTLAGSALATRRSVVDRRGDPARPVGLPVELPPDAERCALPIEVAHRPIGVLVLAARDGGFPAEALAALDPYLEVCGGAIAQYGVHRRRRQAERALERRDRMLRGATELAMILSGVASEQAAIDTAAAIIGPATDADRVVVTEALRTARGVFVQRRRATWRVPGGLADSAEREGEGDGAPDSHSGDDRADLDAMDLISGEMDLVSGSGAWRADAEGLDGRDLVSVPVLVAGQWWGTIGVFGAGIDGDWSAAATDILQTAANALGASLGLFAARRAVDRAIARQRASEEARMRSEVRFRALVQGSSDILALLDAEGRYRYQSPSVRTVLGLEPEETDGRPFIDGVHPDDAERCAWNLLALRRSPGEAMQFECRHRHRDGGWRTLDVTIRNALRDPEVEGFIVNARDITPQRRLWAQLVQSQKMEGLGRLASGIAHDFNNLLVIILNYAEMVRETLGPDGPAVEDVDAILDAGRSAAGLTRRLLAFGSAQPMASRPISMVELLAGLEKMCLRIVGEGIALAVRTDPHLWPAHGDAGQIEQVLLNLVINARDAMPDGGRIDIEARNDRVRPARETSDPAPAVAEEAPEDETGGGLDEATGFPCEPGEYVVVSVRDTGEGMTPEVLRRIFEPFFTTKERGKGTGLGLATVFGIVRQHRGRVMVTSAPGEGSRFEVWLPRSSRSPVTDREGGPGERPSPGGTIVVLEDEPAVRQLVERMLRRLHYDVFVTDDAEQARRRCEADDVVLLLCDVVMPGMSGPELAARVRAMRPRLPVLYMSGHTDELLHRHGRPDAEALLAKPFTLDTLAARVAAALSES